MYTLYLYHDPMCSWCWGYRPISDQLIDALPKNIQFKYILGGLAPDTEQTMPKDMQHAISGYWQKVHDLLGTEFNFDFWKHCTPQRSTYPACRAVIAADKQQAARAMTDAIQRAYYLRAMNPSSNDTLQQLAKELALDEKQFAQDLVSPEIEDKLQKDIAFSRSSPIQGFPSLALAIEDRLVPIVQDYTNYQVTLDDIARVIAS